MRLTAIATALLLCSLAAVPAVAQKPSPEDPQQQADKAPPPVIGELVSVDTNAKTFVIKTAAEGDVKFSYTDQTVIVGAERLESGLAATPGTEATVHYDTHGTARVATRIELKAKK